jgi:hypothetical protein
MTINPDNIDVSTKRKRRKAISLIIELLARVRYAEEYSLHRIPLNLQGGEAFLEAEEAVDCLDEAICVLANAFE